MKSILFITPFTPNNLGAGVSYTCRLLRELSKTCNIDLVYFRYDKDPSYSIPNERIHVLEEVLISKYDKLKALIRHPFIFPLFTSRYKRSVCKILLKQIELVDYDFVYFDFSQTFCYAKYIHHPHKILMAHDVIAQKYSRMKTYFKPWVKYSEHRLLNFGEVLFTFSEKDCLLIKELYNLPALATTFFLSENVVKAIPDVEGNYFVFFGSWNRIENCEALEWFIDNVYFSISKSSLSFKVIGGNLPPMLSNKICKIPKFEYLGFMDNPYPIIANARALIAPLHMGAGVKVKCIETLGCGTPIIGTEVAFEGIEHRYDFAMFEANTPSEYVDKINSFNYSLEKKLELKSHFVENYNNKQILRFINE